MNRFGRHSLANCGTGYGRSAHHNKIATVAREEALFASGVSSRREQAGLLPDADDRHSDMGVTTKAGDSEPTFSFADFNFTVHGAVSHNGRSSLLQGASCKISGAAAHDAEKSKIATF